VRRVITVAGNLNPNLINRHHRVPEMAVAPWPIPRTDLALMMLWGARDTTIPTPLATLMATETVAGCKTSLTVKGTTHVKGWVDWWTAQAALPMGNCEGFGGERFTKLPPLG
jgi:hypothetical protein